MAVVYSIFITLALFSGALGGGTVSMVWSGISENLTVDIMLIALLRLLGATGAIIAVILADRVKSYILARDVLIGAVALEAASVIGLSMGREFWHLGMWCVFLGAFAGLCLKLVCYLLREIQYPSSSLVFAGGSAGFAAGVLLLDRVMEMGQSWRTACQILAIVQIILSMILFFLRRVILSDFAALVRKNRREAEIRRVRRRDELVKEKGAVDERAQGVYLIKLLGLYACAALDGLILLCACHLTFSAQAVQNADGTGYGTGISILTVCLGVTAGRIIAACLHLRPKMQAYAGIILTAVGLAAGILLLNSGETGAAMLLIRAGTGAGAGLVFPVLILLDDERLNEEAQGSLIGLLPAFYLGADAVITLIIRALAEGGNLDLFAVWMLVFTAMMGASFLVGALRLKR